jgi:hypothetical protein
LERELRRQALSIIDGTGDVPAFVTFVLKDLCGFSESAGRWQRGSNVSTEWGRVAHYGRDHQAAPTLARAPKVAFFPSLFRQ